MTYCEYSGLPFDEFLGGLSFSAWELVKGVRRVVVADSAIPERWHILSHRISAGTNYMCVDGADITKESGIRSSGLLRDSLPGLLGSYEFVRHLDVFDSSHCPIMEFVTSKSGNHFVQYHRSRDFSPSNFEFGDIPGKNEAFWVRGATDETGLIVNVTMQYAALLTKKCPRLERDGEDGTYEDIDVNDMITRAWLPGRKVHFFDACDEDRVGMFIRYGATGHGIRETLFRPQLSLMHRRIELVPVAEINSMYYKSMETKKNSSIMLKVTSDGRRACVERVD